uniref:Tryptophan synthase beta chain-like PALP domain-containing protein n=1 Tax=Scylla olivacea TaxID=85551 RepID=A0A0P4W5K8_SCYOL
MCPGGSRDWQDNNSVIKQLPRHCWPGNPCSGAVGGVYAVEPVGKDLQRCLEAKERLWPSPPVFLNTVADSIRLQEVGELTFPIICEYANHRVFTVTDEQMVQGMKLIFERMKQVVEAASGAGVYAAVHLLKDIQPKAQKVGVILCGGNVDLDVLPWLTRTTSYQ